MTRTRLGLAAGIALLGGTLTVHAQNVGQGGRLVGGGFAPVVQQHDTPSAKLPPAPALPGTANAAPAAPSDTLPTDMPPTEALFDAINRGDIEAVRDAINRGADIRGQNVLGMTPTELSVDLGRNDITFLLLSERGADPAPSGPPPGLGKGLAPGMAQGLAQNGKPLRPGRAGSRLVAAQLASTLRASRPARPPAGLAPATVRYAGADPGTPVPQAGFLGFGGGVGSP